MTQKISVHPFSNLIPQHEAFLLDAFGVFWASNVAGMLSGAAETMQILVAQGKQVGILSNSTQLAATEKSKLSKHGIELGVHYHFLLTSGEITHHLLQKEKLPFPTPKKTYWLFGSIHPKYISHLPLFEGTGYTQTESVENADFIYLSIPHVNGLNQENPAVFRSAVQQIAARGIPILCTNPDRFAHEGQPPRQVVRQGSLAALFIEYGASVYFIGKPYPIAYEAALSRFLPSIQKDKILMVGDTPETDIRGAKALGLSTALVVQTGIMADRIQSEGTNAITQLPIEDTPRFFIERFYGF